MVTVTRSGRKSTNRPTTDALFAKSKARADVVRHRSYDGRLVAKKIATRNGNAHPVWGITAYRGEGASPAFLVSYDDASEELMSLHTLLKRHPLPAQSKRPQGKLVSFATGGNHAFLPSHTFFLDT
jgi:hypothetical protein